MEALFSVILNGGTSEQWLDALVRVSAWIVFWAAMRPVVLWYFKIDQLLAHLRGQKQPAKHLAPPHTTPHVP